jgi:DNA-binding MurR/RpiR family transcriptional regulator
MVDNTLKVYEKLIASISEEYPSLSKRLREVAGYALENPTSMALDTIATIAKSANVQPSALIRFAKRFNYSGFREMQRIFQAYVTTHTASYKERITKDMIAIQKSVKDSPSALLRQYCQENIVSLDHLQNGVAAEDLNSAIDLIKLADHIYIIGQRRSLPISTYLTYTLSHIGRKVHLLDGIGGLLNEQCTNITKNDLVICISFYPYSSEVQHVIQHISKEKTPYVAISDNKISPISRNATVSFSIHDAEVHGFRSLTASMLLAQTLATSLLFDEK